MLFGLSFKLFQRFSGNVSQKIDVFAFGVILLELLTGKTATFKEEEGNSPICIWKWASEIIVKQKQSTSSIVDKKLKSPFPKPVAKKLSRIALSCVDLDPSKRPSMDEVSESLNLFEVYLK